jgi:hypothetical protein
MNYSLACGYILGLCLCGGPEIAETAVDLGNRIHQMQPPRFMHGHRKLPFEIDLGQAQRFQRANALGIETRFFLFGYTAAVLDFFHALLKPRARVDKSFSGVSHAVSSPFWYWFLIPADDYIDNDRQEQRPDHQRVQLEVRVKKQGVSVVICEWLFVIRQQLETSILLTDSKRIPFSLIQGKIRNHQ